MRTSNLIIKWVTTALMVGAPCLKAMGQANIISGILTQHANYTITSGSDNIKRYQETIVAKLLDMQKESKTGLVELDLGETYRDSARKSMNYDGNQYAGSSHYDSVNYQKAFVDAYNTVTGLSGFAVISVGYKQSADKGEHTKWSNYSNTVRAYAFVGPTENSMVKLGAYSVQLLNLAKAIEQMSLQYESIVKDLTSKYQAQLIREGKSQDGIGKEISELLKNSEIHYSIRIFKDNEDFTRLAKNLDDLAERVNKEKGIAEQEIQTLKDPERTLNLPQYFYMKSRGMDPDQWLKDQSFRPVDGEQFKGKISYGRFEPIYSSDSGSSTSSYSVCVSRTNDLGLKAMCSMKNAIECSQAPFCRIH